MTVGKGFVIIFLSGLLCAVGGGAAGYALAVVAPGYYRGTLEAGGDPDFDPVAVGLGLGISQGLIVGLLVGAVVVLAVAWYNSRREALSRGFSLDLAKRPASAAGPSEAFFHPTRPGG